jgi:hypothetical protein
MVAIGSLAVGASAAAPLSVVFHATQSRCVGGVSNHTLTALSLYDGDNALDIAVDITRNASTGRFQACFPTGVVDHGLTLIASSNFGPVSYTVPDLTVRIDRVTDKVSGHSHTHHSVTVRAYDCVIQVGVSCPRVATRTTLVSASGHYSADMTSAFDLRGTDKVTVTDTSSHGDTWQVFRYVPYVLAYSGITMVQGIMNPSQAATFRLKDHPGGTILDTQPATGDVGFGNFLSFFVVQIRAGRQVTGDFASDARVTLPSTHTTFEISHGDQLIHTRCLPNRPMRVYWQGTHQHGVQRIADSHGRATVNLSTAESDHFRLPIGAAVNTICQTPAGDLIRSSAFPPAP